YPRDANLADLFAAAAERAPGAVAVVCGERRLTYGELRRRAEDLGGRLAALGVGPEAVVGVCVERSPELVVALLGVVAAGGAYLPLDPAWPAERLAQLIAGAGARVVVSDGSVAEAALAAGGADAAALGGGGTKDAGLEDGGTKDAGLAGGGVKDAALGGGGVKDAGLEDGGTKDAGLEGG